MPTSRRLLPEAMIPELSAAVHRGWKLAGMRCEKETRVRANGRTWKVSRFSGLRGGRLEARVHILPEHGGAEDDSTGILSSGDVPVIHTFTAILKKRGYAGYWDVADGPPRGFFRKTLKNLEDLRRERHLLERLELGISKRK